MIRPVWEGHIRLSLVTCPVALFKATSEGESIHFHLLHRSTHRRVKQAWKDPSLPPGSQEVAREELVHGYELDRDQYVIVDDAELRSIRLETTKTIQIERFVAAETIDRLYWDQSYYVAPSGKKTLQEPFAVIRDAMLNSDRIALGRVVMAGRERVVAIEPRNGGLLLSTLHAHDEVRSDTEVFEGLDQLKGEPEMVEIAEAIIAKQSGVFDPGEFHDRYAEALRDLVQRKAGTSIVAAVEAPMPESNVVDLMEALQRSLKGAQSGEKTKPRSRRRQKAS
jgi:DNA end-binding protein Ku